MSSWLFNIYMDCVVREVIGRMLGRDINLVDSDDRVENKSATVCG